MGDTDDKSIMDVVLFDILPEVNESLERILKITSWFDKHRESERRKLSQSLGVYWCQCHSEFSSHCSTPRRSHSRHQK